MCTDPQKKKKKKRVVVFQVRLGSLWWKEGEEGLNFHEENVPLYFEKKK
jgi:hypothetical protein